MKDIRQQALDSHANPTPVKIGITI